MFEVVNLLPAIYSVDVEATDLTANLS